MSIFDWKDIAIFAIVMAVWCFHAWLRTAYRERKPISKPINFDVTDTVRDNMGTRPTL